MSPWLPFRQWKLQSMTPVVKDRDGNIKRKLTAVGKNKQEIS